MKAEPETAAPRTGTSQRKTNLLVALGSAAVLTIYATGYARTRSAASRLEVADRARVVIPAPPISAQATPDPVVTPAAPVFKARKARSRATEPAGQPRPDETYSASAAAPVVSPSPTPAATPTPTPTAAGSADPAAPAPPIYKDGTYTGWGTSRHGDIEATVTIQAGRIASAVISQCLTRYSCSWVAHLQGQVVTRQSPEVDYVSGATQSTNAFYYAVVQALSKAK